MSEAKIFPRRLSFSKICDILVGYLNAGADNQFVGVSEVVEKSNVTLHNISRNNNFLKSWNFVEEKENEPGKYKLNREAAEFAYAYRIDPNGEQTKLILNKILSKDPVLTAFVERIRRENLSRDTVLIELPRVIGDLRADKVGLSAFLDMMAYAFRLEELSVTGKILRPPKETRRTVRAATKVEPTAPIITAKSPSANISINLTISPEVTPEKLKEYIKAILEAYAEHYKEE
ncbi:hypothetical protein KEJ18_07190 [Candidatus Bathyarchaeota archaeon]|nr:hypothetical protein [Candidatus Bathyarchaeota archaeon]